MSVKIYEEGEREARKSEKVSRAFRQVEKNHLDSRKKVSNRRLDRLDLQLDLIGKIVPTTERDNYGNKIKPVIKHVYPHMVECECKVIKETDDGNIITGPFRICYSTSELVSYGVISFDSGRAEVVR